MLNKIINNENEKIFIISICPKMSDELNSSESIECNTFSCKCIKCTHNNNKYNRTNEIASSNCNKMLNTIVNRMIVKTKMNSIDLLNKLHNLLPPDKEKKQLNSNKISSNRMHFVYKPFSKSCKFNEKSSVNKNKQKRKLNSQIQYFNFDFTDKNETNNNNNISNENIIKPLAWETSIRLKRNRKNRFLKSNKKQNKKVSHSKHLFSLARIRTHKLITKSDLSSKVKFTQFIRSGSDLKKFLLNNTCNNNIKVEPSSDVSIARCDETTSQLSNNLLNENVNNIPVCHLEQNSGSLYNNEIIKRVLKLKQ